MDFTKLKVLESDKSPIPILFAARMLVVYLLWIRGFKVIVPPFLPFIQSLDSLNTIPFLYQFLTVLYWICMLGILLGWKFQKWSLALGLLIIFQILSSKLQYSTSFLFSGCLMLLIGLYRPGLEWIFRWQIGILYFGAGLNKLLQDDWLSGQYFENFLVNVFPNILNGEMVKIFGLETLSVILSRLTIMIELGLCLWAFLGKKPLTLFFSILSFHLFMLVFTLGELSYIYFYLMATAAILILPWQVNEKKPSLDSGVGKNRWLRKSKFSFRLSLKSKEYQHLIESNSFDSSQLQKFRSITFYKFCYFSSICSIVFLAKYKDKLITILE